MSKSLFVTAASLVEYPILVIVLGVLFILRDDIGPVLNLLGSNWFIVFVLLPVMVFFGAVVITASATWRARLSEILAPLFFILVMSVFSSLKSIVNQIHHLPLRLWVGIALIGLLMIFLFFRILRRVPAETIILSD